MGITSSDVKLIEMALSIEPDISTVIELGSQNLYINGSDSVKPPFASEYYRALGLKYTCIDLAGDNGAVKVDLSDNRPMVFTGFDLVTDFGTSEHVVADIEMKSHAFHEGHINSMYPTRIPTEEEISLGYYRCWIKKHELTDLYGIMINVNPKTGNWPDHGYTYITKEFYEKLAEMMDYDIIHLEENMAMGNPNAINIECILRKRESAPFVTFEQFKLLPQYRS
jgi:hypothetical protein